MAPVTAHAVVPDSVLDFVRQGARVRGDWVSLAYIVTIVSFIVALRYLSDPAKARHGNRVGAVGMAIAIVATFFLPGLDSGQFVWVIIVMAVTAPSAPTPRAP